MNHYCNFVGKFFSLDILMIFEQEGFQALLILYLLGRSVANTSEKDLVPLAFQVYYLTFDHLFSFTFCRHWD